MESWPLRSVLAYALKHRTGIRQFCAQVTGVPPRCNSDATNQVKCCCSGCLSSWNTTGGEESSKELYCISSELQSTVICWASLYSTNCTVPGLRVERGASELACPSLQHRREGAAVGDQQGGANKGETSREGPAELNQQQRKGDSEESIRRKLVHHRRWHLAERGARVRAKHSFRRERQAHVSTVFSVCSPREARSTRGQPAPPASRSPHRTQFV